MTGIWVYLLGVLAIAVAAIPMARAKLANGLAVAAAGLAALIGYGLVGAPGQPDMPFENRMADLAKVDPADFTPAERLARLQALIKERPDDPQPHYFIGQIMLAEAREDEAALAFQAALRRDDAFVPALVALGDVLMERAGGNIGPQAQQLYSRAYQLDNTQSLAGIFAGLGAYQMGETDRALQAWAIVRGTLAENDASKHRMLDALEARARGETAE